MGCLPSKNRSEDTIVVYGSDCGEPAVEQVILQLSDKTVEVVKATRGMFTGKALEITTDFFKRLLEKHPNVGRMFDKAGLDNGVKQEQLAIAMVTYAMNIEDLTPMLPTITRMNVRHCAEKVKPELYRIVHDVFMESFRDVMGTACTREVGEAWSDALLSLSGFMIQEEQKFVRAAEKMNNLIRKNYGWTAFKEFVLIKKEEVGTDSIAFSFQPKDDSRGCTFDFKAGQYLTIRVDQDGCKKALRHYIITSKPGNDFLQCVPRLVKGGTVTTYMHTELEVGDTVKLAPPRGLFLRDEKYKDAPVVLLTAGSGITLALALANAPEIRVVNAVHVDRTKEHGAALVAKLKESVGKEALAGMKELYGASHEEVWESVKDVANAHTEADFIVSGPASFMQDARTTLEDCGCTNVECVVFSAERSAKKETESRRISIDFSRTH